MGKKIVIITLIVMAIICLYAPVITPGYGPSGRDFLFDVKSYHRINFGQLAVQIFVAGLIGFGAAFAVGKKGKK